MSEYDTIRQSVDYAISHPDCEGKTYVLKEMMRAIEKKDLLPEEIRELRLKIAEALGNNRTVHNGPVYLTAFSKLKDA